MLRIQSSCVCVFVLLPFVAVAAEVVEEKSADGKVEARYEVDAEKRKHGAYTGFHPNGTPHVKATYKAGELNGPYVEYTEKGQKSLTATYRNGKLHGTLSQYEKNTAILTQAFKDGEPVYRRSLEQIKKKLAELTAAPEKIKDEDAAEREGALRRLKAYRYLVEVPYDNLVLDNDYTRFAEAGAKLCEKLGRLEHKPANPGMPEAEFKVAYNGTSHSNLAMGQATLTQALDDWLNDSDESNIDRLGHRRWCLNPPLQKVGFGRSGKVSAMYAFDRSQKMVPEFDFVCYPPRGLMPIEFFGPRHAWNLSLNPKKYQAPGKNVKPKVFALDERLSKLGEPLTLDYEQVSNAGFGLPNCLIFRPEGIELTAGKHYLVEIEGLARLDGKGPPVRYVVEFASVK